MSAFTFGSLYSGGGGADVGLVAAGGVPMFAVEHDAQVAEVYRANLGDHIIVGDASDVNVSRLEPVDLLWVSEPCQGHSVARSKKLEARHDADLSAVTGRYIEALRPRVVIMENVPPYARSDAYRAHVALLCRLGYMVDAQVINAADAGVAQTRRRLIVRAVRGSLVPNLPPPVRPWVGWYAAIEDLLPTLPESRFADWQLKRLPALLTDTPVTSTEMRDFTTRNAQEPMWSLSASVGYKGPPRAFLVSTAATEADPAWSVTGESAGRVRALLVSSNSIDGGQPASRHDTEPAVTVDTKTATHVRALLVDGQATDHGQRVTVRHGDAPAFTTHAQAGARHQVRAFIADGRLGDMSTCMTTRDADEPMFTVNRMEKQARKAWLACGRVVAMNPRALARFQSVPDSYILPERRALAARVLGNMVPPLLSQRLAEGLMEALR